MEYIFILAKIGVFARIAIVVSIPLLIFSSFVVAISVKYFAKPVGKLSKTWLIVLCMVVIISCALNFFSNRTILMEAEDMLSDVSTYQVFVENKKIEFREDLLVAWKSRFYTKNKGSHPIRFISMEIKSPEGSLKFELGLDSRSPNMYWVNFATYDANHILCYINFSRSIGSDIH